MCETATVEETLSSTISLWVLTLNWESQFSEEHLKAPGKRAVSLRGTSCCINRLSARAAERVSQPAEEPGTCVEPFTVMGFTRTITAFDNFKRWVPAMASPNCHVLVTFSLRLHECLSAGSAVCLGSCSQGELVPRIHHPNNNNKKAKC